VPQDLLIRLAGLSHHDRTAFPRAPDGRPGEAPAAADDDAGTRSHGATGTAAIQNEHRGTLLPLGGDDDHQASEAARAAGELAERSILSVVAPLLPRLIPPQAMGMPILPVAAATARQGARAEAAIAEDDLSVLASRIKRILNEEARRHGIDV
jgi:hypothetical protein